MMRNQFLSLSSPWVVRTGLDDGLLDLKTNDCIFVEFVTKCSTLEDFYSEISSLLSFPDYFGRNFAALRDCLNDGDIISAPCLCLIFPDGRNLLVDDSSDVLSGLIDTLNLVGSDWAAGGEWPWNFPPRSFHAVIRVEEGNQRFDHVPRFHGAENRGA